MIRKVVSPLAICVVALGLSNVQAAPQQHDRDDPAWYQNRDNFYRGEGWKMRLFERVREDVTRVQQASFSRGDEYRLSKTIEELNDLQTKLTASNYDEPELDRVIGALGRVVADNRLNPKDRDVLTDDLSRLRDYREHHANWR
jgi:hypothetical protein